MERAVALEERIVAPEAIEEGVVVGVREFRLAAIPQVRAESRQAAVAESRAAGVAVHQPDTLITISSRFTTSMPMSTPCLQRSRR